MLRRLVIAGLATALAAPAFTVTPASAAVLFTCPAIDSGLGTNYFGLTPGLSHNQTAQTANQSYIPITASPCSNGETGFILVGPISAAGLNSLTTFGPRPLGCPVAWGGAGPDYPDQTPILLGADPSFQVNWSPSATTSSGIAKVKQGATGTQWRLVFNITAGQYTPPAGKKTKIKFAANIAPDTSNDLSHTCADDSDPLSFLTLTSVGSVIVNQK